MSPDVRVLPMLGHPSQPVSLGAVEETARCSGCWASGGCRSWGSGARMSEHMDLRVPLLSLVLVLALALVLPLTQRPSPP